MKEEVFSYYFTHAFVNGSYVSINSDLVRLSPVESTYERFAILFGRTLEIPVLVQSLKSSNIKLG